MVNAWSLLYEELNGTMDEVYPVMTDNTITPQESDEYDPIVGLGNTATTYTVSDAGGADYFNFDFENDIHDTFSYNTILNNKPLIDTDKVHNLDEPLTINLSASESYKVYGLVLQGGKVGNNILLPLFFP